MKATSKIVWRAPGILIPGGFGERGSEGKKIAIRYARVNNVPLLGICFGMQLALIEYAEHVLNLPQANSTEFDPETPDPIIDFLHDQYQGIKMGGTLRLGQYDCQLTPGSLAYKCYGQDLIKERHRHRYEFNNKYKDLFMASKMKITGINPAKRTRRDRGARRPSLLCLLPIPPRVLFASPPPESLIPGIREGSGAESKVASLTKRTTPRGCSFLNSGRFKYSIRP
jgi:hypothetical protein